MAVIDNSPLMGQAWDKVTSGVVKSLEHDPRMVDLNARIKEVLGEGGNITMETFGLANDGSGTIDRVNQYDLKDGKVTLGDNLLMVTGMDQRPSDPIDSTFQFSDLTGAGVQTQPDGVRSLILFQDLGGNNKTVFRLTKR